MKTAQDGESSQEKRCRIMDNAISFDHGKFLPYAYSRFPTERKEGITPIHHLGYPVRKLIWPEFFCIFAPRLLVLAYPKLSITVIAGCCLLDFFEIGIHEYARQVFLNPTLAGSTLRVVLMRQCHYMPHDNTLDKTGLFNPGGGAERVDNPLVLSPLLAVVVDKSWEKLVNNGDGESSQEKRCRIMDNAILASVVANFSPMHILGPQPKGKKALFPLVALDIPSENLSGSNSSASSPQRSSSRVDHLSVLSPLLTLIVDKSCKKLVNNGMQAWLSKFLYLCQCLSDQLRLGDCDYWLSAKPHKMLFSCNSSETCRITMAMANHNLRTQNLSHPWFTGFMPALTDLKSDLIRNCQAKQKAEAYAGRARQRFNTKMRTPFSKERIFLSLHVSVGDIKRMVYMFLLEILREWFGEGIRTTRDYAFLHTDASPGVTYV
ncbi:hypothetical protein Cgig2_006220 [Carnegiea gigantea]|uniref:Uncharacterized protein n=1 Tax=Carnegiea gigantea TaxID=171969 RepID=A0A9Q1QU63_9CARY|nr:hypothetical protein Cgig2_006220 [Carnegiea gigantea]